MNRVDEIIRLEKEAEEAEGEASDKRWQVAQLISEELATGMSQRMLADKIGKSQMHVSRMNAVWDRNARVSPRPSFSEAYNEVNPRGPHSAESAERGNGHAPGVTSRKNNGWEPGSGAPRLNGNGEGWKPGDGPPKNRREYESDPRSMAAIWIATVAANIDSLAEHRTAWDFITDEDVDVWEEARAKANELNLRDHPRFVGRRASAQGRQGL